MLTLLDSSLAGFLICTSVPLLRNSKSAFFAMKLFSFSVNISSLKRY